MDDRPHARIESAGIRGFRSLADVNVEDLLPVAVLGANGSGKFNVMRFFFQRPYRRQRQDAGRAVD